MSRLVGEERVSKPSRYFWEDHARKEQRPNQEHILATIRRPARLGHCGQAGAGMVVEDTRWERLCGVRSRRVWRLFWGLGISLWEKWDTKAGISAEEWNDLMHILKRLFWFLSWEYTKEHKGRSQETKWKWLQQSGRGICRGWKVIRILGVDFKGRANIIFLTQIQSLRFLLHWYPPSLSQTVLPKCWERETSCYFLK